MDYQPPMIGSVPGGDEVADRAAVVADRARVVGVQVIHVRLAFRPADHAAVPERNKLFFGMAGAGAFLDGSPEFDIDPRLKPAADEIVVTKTRVGAFSTTDLAAHLRAKSVETLVLGGIATSGVVLSTVRDAADRDFGLYVLSDCCADGDERAHRLLLETVFPMQATVLSSGELWQ
jgi:nicotinamidase-related amidase